jgi:C4-dicarboxylate-specific signal transduction histidine kinase
VKSIAATQPSNAGHCNGVKQINVADVVEESLRVIAWSVARDGVALRRDYSPARAIACDKDRLLQILVILMRNARSACQAASREDKWMTLRIDSPGDAVCISVIDNGVGIPTAEVPRLFTEDVTTGESGRGLGLYIAALGAREIGGSLRAESAGEGCGAAFVLELPYALFDSHD